MSNKNRTVQIESVKNHLKVADKCTVAESFFSRLRGLIGVRSLEEGEGLLLSPCNDIHMWFMSIPIDVVFVSHANGVYRVTSVRRDVRPWKLLPMRDSAATETLELPVGTIDRCDIQTGDELCIN